MSPIHRISAAISVHKLDENIFSSGVDLDDFDLNELSNLGR